MRLPTWISKEQGNDSHPQHKIVAEAASAGAAEVSSDAGSVRHETEAAQRH